MYNHQLDAFLKAAELGSFGKAAQALYISTPAMIQQNVIRAALHGPVQIFLPADGKRLDQRSVRQTSQPSDVRLILLPVQLGQPDHPVI